MDGKEFSSIRESEVSEWQDSADLIIVGFGMAGASAALGGCESGSNVLVLEKGSGVNGTTTIAAGHFYLGGGTRPQLVNKIEDSNEDMFNYLMANTPDPDVEKIRLYCEQSVDHFSWLEKQGIPFNDGFYRQKHVEQPTDECLIWSGNEKAWPVSEKARPAPRGHKVAIEGSGGGNLAMKKMLESAEQRGVRFQYNAAVKSLVVDDGNHVTGVHYCQFGQSYYVRANKAVILAAGGFSMNPEMLREHCPRLAEEGVMKQGNPNDDGAGIQLGVSVGGVTSHMDGALITSPFYPPESLIKGILINKHGNRFINEDCYHSRTTDACLQQSEGKAWLICDNAIFGRPLFGMQELVDAWETVEEMEQDLKLPRGELQKTLASYNDFTKQGEDPEFHKHSDWLQPIVEPPFAAIQCSFNQSIYVGFTLGGLKVSIDGQVLDENSQPVPGLYAAGACASNIAQDGAGYSSGTCLGEASFFGRRAGKHGGALSEKNEQEKHKKVAIKTAVEV